MKLNAVLTGLLVAGVVPALAAAETGESLEMVTVTGSRAAPPRTSLQSLEPVDVLSRELIDQTASAELVETLATLVPSFNVQTLPALDATIFVRPARLRNL